MKSFLQGIKLTVILFILILIIFKADFIFNYFIKFLMKPLSNYSMTISGELFSILIVLIAFVLILISTLSFFLGIQVGKNSNRKYDNILKRKKDDENNNINKNIKNKNEEKEILL